MFKSSVHRILVPCLVLVAFVTGFYRVAHHPSPTSFSLPAIAGEPKKKSPEIHTHFASTQQRIQVHAASLVELGDGRVRAFWFAGSREGASDVEIRSAVFDPSKNIWGAEHTVVNRLETEFDLRRYVRKLGNPVSIRTPNGKLWLFYVTVSLGGWAGSSITAMTSADEGESWSPSRRLITSPFLNISTLVKGTPFLYGDGTIGLPVYHEFIGKFGELLRISDEGEVIDKQRLSSGKTTLQPVVLIRNPQQALVLMRYTGTSPRRVMAARTDDAGLHWSAPERTMLANPDAAISGVRLQDGSILVALNNTESGRDSLSLVLSSDEGASWKTIYQLEDQHSSSSIDPEHFVQTTSELAMITEPNISNPAIYGESAKRNKCEAQHCSFEFSYPYLLQSSKGDFHIVYSWNRSFIKHVQFSSSWLNQQINKNVDDKLH